MAEMSVRTLALGLYAVTILVHLGWSHVAPVRHREFFLLGLNATTLGIYGTLAGWLRLPVVYSPVLDGFLGLAYLLGPMCLYAEVWSLTERSVTLRLLVDLLECGPSSREDLVLNYGAGKGLSGLWDRRVRQLVGLRLLQWNGRCLVLTPSGSALAVVLGACRRMFRL